MNGCSFRAICALLVAILFLPGLTEAANVVFVGDVDGDEIGDGSDPAYAAADTSMISHISTVLGHTVTTVDDSLATAISLAGADFVVLSATAASGAFATADSGDGSSGATNALATNATIILMESGNAIVAAFGLTASTTIGPSLGTQIDIVELDGYLTNGFELGTIDIYDNPEFGGEEIRAFGATAPIGANNGFPQVDYIGDRRLGITTGSPFQAVSLGTHRIGDNLIVAFPFGNGGFTHLTAAGLELFNNAFSPPSPDVDYNDDGVVNAADYVAWRKTPEDFGGDPDGYNLWQAYFGTLSESGGAIGVPEPCTTTVLLVIGLVSTCARTLSRNGRRM